MWTVVRFHHLASGGPYLANYCISLNSFEILHPRIFLAMGKSFHPSILFLPHAHYQDVCVRKETKSKFHQEDREKIQNYWKFGKLRMLDDYRIYVYLRVIITDWYAKFIEMNVLIGWLSRASPAERQLNGINGKISFSAFEWYEIWVWFAGLDWSIFESQPGIRIGFWLDTICMCV